MRDFMNPTTLTHAERMYLRQCVKALEQRLSTKDMPEYDSAAFQAEVDAQEYAAYLRLREKFGTLV